MNTTNVEIEKYSFEYANEVADLAVDAWAPMGEEYKKILGNEIYSVAFKNWQKAIEDRVLNKMHYYHAFVAKVDGVFAGFISYTINEETMVGEICDNAVAPKYRGMGIAKKMYDFVIEDMKTKGVKVVTVTTSLDDAHLPARKAYESEGFEKTLQSVTYYKKI